MHENLLKLLETASMLLQDLAHRLCSDLNDNAALLNIWPLADTTFPAWSFWNMICVVFFLETHTAPSLPLVCSAYLPAFCTFYVLGKWAPKTSDKHWQKEIRMYQEFHAVQVLRIADERYPSAKARALVATRLCLEHSRAQHCSHLKEAEHFAHQIVALAGPVEHLNSSTRYGRCCQPTNSASEVIFLSVKASLTDWSTNCRPQAKMEWCDPLWKIPLQDLWQALCVCGKSSTWECRHTTTIRKPWQGLDLSRENANLPENSEIHIQGMCFREGDTAVQDLWKACLKVIEISGRFGNHWEAIMQLKLW